MLLSASIGIEGTPESLGRGLRLPSAGSLRAPRVKNTEYHKFCPKRTVTVPACTLQHGQMMEGTAAPPRSIHHEPPPRGGTAPTLAEILIPKCFRDAEHCERGAAVSEKHPCAPAKPQLGTATRPSHSPKPASEPRRGSAERRRHVHGTLPRQLRPQPSSEPRGQVTVTTCCPRGTSCRREAAAAGAPGRSQRPSAARGRREPCEVLRRARRPSWCRWDGKRERREKNGEKRAHLT